MNEPTDEISVLINKVFAKLFQLRDERDHWKRARESAVEAGDAMLKELTELRKIARHYDDLHAAGVDNWEGYRRNYEPQEDEA